MSLEAIKAMKKSVDLNNMFSNVASVIGVLGAKYSKYDYNVASIVFIRDKLAHLSFLEQVVHNYKMGVPVDLLDHLHCDFGKFYYSDGIQFYGKDPDFIAVEELHIKVHSLGIRLMEGMSIGTKDENDSILNELQGIVGRLVGNLNILIDRYEKS